MKLPRESSVHYPILLFVVMLGLAARVHATIIAGVGRNCAWFMFVCLSLVLFGVWLQLKIRQRDGDSLVHAAEQIGSVIAGRIVYAGYALLFLGLTGYIDYVCGDFISRTFLNGQPRTYIVLEAVFAVLVALFPIETHARFAHILMIFVVPFFFLISLSPLLKTEWVWAAPIYSPREITAPWSALATAMLMFTPLTAIGLISKKKAEMNGLSILLLTALITVFVAFMLEEGIALFGTVRVKEIVYPGYSIIDSVQLESFVLERIVFVWIIYRYFILLVAGGFALRCASRAFAGILGVRLHWVCIIICGFISGGGILLVQDSFRFLHFQITLGYYTVFMLIVLPLLLYGLMRLKGGLK